MHTQTQDEQRVHAWLQKNAEAGNRKEQLDNAAVAGKDFHVYCVMIRKNKDHDLIPALLEIFWQERELDLDDPEVAEIFYSHAPYAREGAAS